MGASEIGREWFPASWVDEVCPPSKPRPEDFAIFEKANGTWWLGYAADDQRVLADDRETFNELLEPGAIVHFMSCDRFDDVVITVSRDGLVQLPSPLPVSWTLANAVTLYGDIDTLAASFDDMLAAISRPDHESHDYVTAMIFEGEEADTVRATLQAARWSDPLPHLFEVEDGKPVFRQVPAHANRN